MIQNEIQKTELKRQLWNADNCFLMNDSLSNTTINLEFQAIENGLYSMLTRQPKRANLNYLVKNDSVIDKLRNGKIVINSMGGL